MTSPQDLALLSRDDLVVVVAELQGQRAEWRAEIDPRRRGGKRQAAPFSRGTRVADPKPPGRKPGSGSFRDRASPQPDELTEPPVDVRGLVDAGPACGGPLAAARVDRALRTELPVRPRPQVTPSRVGVCRCVSGGRQGRGQHPEVAPDQGGATAHRLGARLRAAAPLLPYGVGMPVRKVPAVLPALTGVRLTPGALTRDARPHAEGPLGTADAGVRAAMPGAPMVHTDDTGWRVGGEPADVMAVETETATVDQMRTRHRHEAVQEVIPADEAGVMGTDRGRSDDARAFDGVPQQKGLAHIQRSSSEVLATKVGRARDVGEQLKGRLQEARELWPASRDQRTDCKVDAEARPQEISSQLRHRRRNDPDQQRVLHELGWHHDRGHLRRFVVDPRVEPTNNRAERALRPAVIARKVSQGSKNDRGAVAFAVFTRVIRTLITTDTASMVDTLSHLLRPTPRQYAST
jgi:transposase